MFLPICPCACLPIFVPHSKCTHVSHAIPFPLSSCCFWAAVLTKETGVSLLGIAAAYEIFLVLPRGGGLSRGGRLPGGLGLHVWGRLPGSLLRLLMLAGAGAAYAYLRLSLMSKEGGSFSFAAASLAESQLIRRAENPLLFVSRRGEWAMSVAYVQVSDRPTPSTPPLSTDPPPFPPFPKQGSRRRIIFFLFFQVQEGG